MRAAFTEKARGKPSRDDRLANRRATNASSSNRSCQRWTEALDEAQEYPGT